MSERPTVGTLPAPKINVTRNEEPSARVPAETPVNKNNGRPKRQPVSQRKVLSAPSREGFVRRWVLDKDERIKLFEEGGWSPVKNDGGMETADKSRMAESALGSVVTRHTGGGVKSVLMEIPEDWYNEDQKEKSKRINDGEKAILSRRTEGQYGNIQIER